MVSRKVFSFFSVLLSYSLALAVGSDQVEHCFSHGYLEKAYDASAEAYTHENRDRYYPMAVFAEINKKIPKNSNVLDAGC
jgi:hypothetical protein